MMILLRITASTHSMAIRNFDLESSSSSAGLNIDSAQSTRKMMPSRPDRFRSSSSSLSESALRQCWDMVNWVYGNDAVCCEIKPVYKINCLHCPEDLKLAAKYYAPKRIVKVDVVIVNPTIFLFLSTSNQCGRAVFLSKLSQLKTIKGLFKYPETMSNITAHHQVSVKRRLILALRG